MSGLDERTRGCETAEEWREKNKERVSRCEAGIRVEVCEGGGGVQDKHVMRFHSAVFFRVGPLGEVAPACQSLNFSEPVGPPLYDLFNCEKDQLYSFIVA